MRKTREDIQRAAEAWIEDLQVEYPQAATEIVMDAPGGFDVWVRVGLPEDADEDVDLEALYSTVRLNQKYRELTGVNIVATIVDKEAVRHG